MVVLMAIKSINFKFLEQFLFAEDLQELTFFNSEGRRADGINKFIVLVFVHQLGLQKFEHRHCYLKKCVVAFAKPQIPNFTMLKKHIRYYSEGKSARIKSIGPFYQEKFSINS